MKSALYVVEMAYTRKQNIDGVSKMSAKKHASLIGTKKISKNFTKEISSSSLSQVKWEACSEFDDRFECKFSLRYIKTSSITDDIRPSWFENCHWPRSYYYLVARVKDSPTLLFLHDFMTPNTHYRNRIWPKHFELLSYNIICVYRNTPVNNN